MSFSLGSITCPSCSGALELRTLTTTDDGLTASGSLLCPSCSRRVNMTVALALVDLLDCPHEGCLSSFESRQGLAKHQRLVHPAALPTALEPCPECSEPVHPASRLRHQRVCAGPPLAGPPAAPTVEHRCPDCGAQATSARGLVGHRRSHEEPEPCPGGCGRLIKPSGQFRHASSCPGPQPKEPECPTTEAAAVATPGPSTAPTPPEEAAPGPSARASKPRRTSRSTSARPPAPEPDRFRACGYTPDPSTEPCRADELSFEGPRQRWRSVRLEGGRTLYLCPDHAAIRGPELEPSLELARRQESR